ncbi:MAG: ABC transporter ATP-binding protein [Candidatus Lokiarchaeota archaeon]
MVIKTNIKSIKTNSEVNSENEAEINQKRQIVIELKNVSFSYPKGPVKSQEVLPALSNINMKIYKGERVAILGPNGGGKTTLLRILDALTEVSKGSISALGFNLTEDMNNKKKMFKFRKKVGFVFQNPDEELFSPTVYDDIIFGPLHLGLSKEEIEKRANSVMDLFSIQNIKDKHPYNLSGGEKKKASIAAVLSIDPDIILFDEPTSGLDPKSRADLISIINELHKRGKTIITATHDVNATLEIADRVYVLNKHVIAEGPIREIFSDVKLLKDTNLEIPEILKLFKILSAFGYNCEELPLSINEAIDQITQTIETEGGHIHLHIHEHTHNDLKNLKHDFDHNHHFHSVSAHAYEDEN